MDDSLLLHLSEFELLKSLPQLDPWRRISLYEHRDLCRQLLEHRHSVAPVDASVRSVSAYLAQGHRYFEAAERADLLVKPLLMFYGVMSLGEATVFAATSGPLDEKLCASHGLKRTNWKNTLTNGVDRISDLQVRVNHGTFAALWNTTHNVERSLVHCSGRMRCPLVQEGTSAVTPSQNVTLRFGDVLARIPDLCDVFQETQQQMAACYPAHVHRYGTMQTDFYLLPTRLGLPSPRRIRKAFGLHSDVEIRQSEHHHRVGDVPGIEFLLNVTTSPVEMRNYVPPVKNDARAIAYLVEPLNKDVNLSSLSLLYVASYVLGMLARYHAADWSDLINGRQGESVLPLISAALEAVRVRVPQLILEELEQDHPGSRLYRHPALT